MDTLGLEKVPGWLLFIVLILLSLYLYTVWCQSVWTKHGVPGPKPVPFLGIMNRYFTKGVSDVDTELRKKYGKVIGTYHGNIPLLLTSDPDMIKQIMVKEFSSFTNRHNPIYIGEVLESGVNLAENEHWKFLRNTLSPTFTTGKLKKMTPLINTCVHILLNVISSKSKTGEEIEMKGLFGGYTIDVIASTGFGLEINSINNPDDPFVRHAKVFFSGAFENPMILLVCIFPWLNKVFRYLDISFFSKKLENFFGSVVNSAIELREKENVKHEDFLHLLMTANKERTALKDNQGRGLTKKEIHGNSLIFMVAGYDTTANTLTFASYCLAINPEMQERLIEEIDREIQTETLQYDNVMKLEYLDMFLSEVLRLYGPVIRTNRKAEKDVTINGVYIPKGTDVSIQQYVIHRDPDFWPNPDKFDPERFTSENKEKRNQYCYLPFGAGPRNCIGMRLALFETKIIIVAILQKFKFVTTEKTEIPPKLGRGGFVKPKNGMFLKLQQR